MGQQQLLLVHRSLSTSSDPSVIDFKITNLYFDINHAELICTYKAFVYGLDKLANGNINVLAGSQRRAVPERGQIKQNAWFPTKVKKEI